MSGLMWYMHRQKDVYHQINIENAIIEHQSSANRKPLVIVDGNCTRNFFVESNPKKYLTGGQFKLYKQKVDEFIDFFEHHNIELVVFFHGCRLTEGICTDNNKINRPQRKNNNIDKCHKVLDAIDNYEVILIKDWEIQLPCYIVVAIKSAFLERCTVKMSTYQECNAEIVHYANTNNAMAVISQDPDFAVSQGSWKFWSIKDLNYKENTVYIYDKENLARTLGLRVDQLPLFRTMIGNKCVNEEILEGWFRYLRIRNRFGTYDRNDKIAKVSRFISNNPNMGIEEISRRAFQKSYSNLIKKSVVFYQGVEEKLEGLLSDDVQWNEILKEATKRMLQSKISPGILGLMLTRVFGVTSSWEDFRKNDIIQADEIWRPLRAKIYGILLHDYPFDKTVIEWTCTNLETIGIASPVEPIPPVCDFQNYKLVDFWAEDKDDILFDISWQLFCKTLNESLPLDRVQNLDRRLLTGIITLLHMIKPCKLSENEIKAFLLVNVLCSTKDDVSELVDDDIRISTRALRLSTIFLKGMHRIRMLSAALGFIFPRQYVVVWNIFDGALLQDFFNFSNDKIILHEKNKLFIEGKKFIDDFKELF